YVNSFCAPREASRTVNRVTLPRAAGRASHNALAIRPLSASLRAVARVPAGNAILAVVDVGAALATARFGVAFRPFVQLPHLDQILANEGNVLSFALRTVLQQRGGHVFVPVFPRQLRDDLYCAHQLLQIATHAAMLLPKKLCGHRSMILARRTFVSCVGR